MAKPSFGASVNSALMISSGLVLCYPMNEGSGTEIADQSATSVDGALTGSVSWATDTTYGSILAFAGGAVELAHNAAINTETCTIQAVFRSGSVGGNQQDLFNKIDLGSFHRPYQVSLINNRIEFFVYGAGSGNAMTSTGYVDSTWRKAVVTRAAQGAMAIYVDTTTPAATGTDATSAGSTLNTSGLYIGQYPGLPSGTAAYAGDLAALSMWNRVLSSDEIASIMADPFAMFRASSSSSSSAAPSGAGRVYGYY